MKLLYRGLVLANGRTRRIGCSSCGGSRPVASSSVVFQDEYKFVYEGRQFRFRTGHTYDVDDELGRILLQKYSYKNGTKIYAFEVSQGDGDPSDDNPQPI